MSLNALRTQFEHTISCTLPPLTFWSFEMTVPADSEQFNSAWEISANSDKMMGLRATLSYITKAEGGLSPQKICEAMLAYARDAYVPSHDLISRFIDSGRKIYRFRKRDHYVMLIYFIGRLAEEFPNLLKGLDEPNNEFTNYCEQYYEKRSRDIRFRDRY